jgi:hypothetical protein
MHGYSSSRIVIDSASVLDELAQAAKSVVPLLGNQVEVVARVFEPPLVQLPNALAPVPCVMRQTRLFHHTQVFGDRLTREVGANREAGDGQRAVITEARDETQARLIA